MVCVHAFYYMRRLRLLESRHGWLLYMLAFVSWFVLESIELKEKWEKMKEGVELAATLQSLGEGTEDDKTNIAFDVHWLQPAHSASNAWDKHEHAGDGMLTKTTSKGVKRRATASRDEPQFFTRDLCGCMA